MVAGQDIDRCVVIAEEAREKLQPHAVRPDVNHLGLNLSGLSRILEPEKKPLAHRWRVLRLKEHAVTADIEASLLDEANAIGIVHKAAALFAPAVPLFGHCILLCQREYSILTGYSLESGDDLFNVNHLK